MKDTETRRLEYALELLEMLALSRMEAEKKACGIECAAPNYISEYIQANKYNIDIEIERYNKNRAEMQKFGSEITESVNSWYNFRSSPESLSSLLFPFSFRLQAARLRQKLKKLNEAVEMLAIENRLIKENIIQLEKRLYEDAVFKFKNELLYRSYETAADKIKELLGELSYLLPTLPGICPRSAAISNPDGLKREIENKLQNGLINTPFS